MASRFMFCGIFSVVVALLAVPGVTGTPVMPVNVIDHCWKTNSNWKNNREQLANCSVGFAGKMTGNIGSVPYVVTDPGDDAVKPSPGTLRYGVVTTKGKVWITFQRDMTIKLAKTLHIGNFTVIDGRGVNVHIAGGACLTIYQAHDVIIHGLHIHHCQSQLAGMEMVPGGKVVSHGRSDADAIRIISSTKVWIDHNTLSECPDGLVDTTRASTNVTISNNRFMNQNKVMLLGSGASLTIDKCMKTTVVYNHFGPNCHQRMPRVRHGYAHVANNLYDGWNQYAIGGSACPSIKSEANLFIAPIRRKQITWNDEKIWNISSVKDVLENGASFTQTGKLEYVNPNYGPDQRFEVADGHFVRDLTSHSGALKL